MSVAATICSGCLLSRSALPRPLAPRGLRFPEGSNLVRSGLRQCRVLPWRSMSRSSTARRFRGRRSISVEEEAGNGEISEIGLLSETTHSLGQPQGGFHTTLNRLSKWLICSIFGIVILWRRDAEALWAAMGSVINVQLSVTLKQIINHERPVPGLRPDPGMPSSHAQSIFYLIHGSGVNLFTILAGTVIIGSSSYFSWLRISQRFHTAAQVIVGAVLGSLCSIVWFWSWHTFVWEAFIASIWVRLVVVLGSFASCVGFVYYVIKHWSDE